VSKRGHITRFGLRNFKPFRFLPDLELRPLTVLCGANSSGKSSILQSLVLLKQSSLQSPIEGCLNFNGKYVNLQDFSKTVSDFDTSLSTEFRFSLEHSVHSVVIDTAIRIVVGRGEGGEYPVVREFELTATSHGESIPSCHFLVREGITRHFEIKEPQRLKSAAAELFTIPKNAKVVFDGLWPKIIEIKGPRRESEFLPLSIFLDDNYAIEVLADSLRNRLTYLGPIRADPRPFYPIDLTLDIECRGEGTIPYLLRHAKDRVTYRLSATGETRRASLLEALNAWLRELQITDGLTINPVEKSGYTAALHTPRVQSRTVDLAQVGFGISQILPVLTIGLAGPDDGLILYEQPEIHLHPRLQAGLADFLLCSAQSGRTILLETHSDHLINRLRRRIAEDPTGELAQAVQILFVHPGTEDDPGSYVESLKIDESGTILNAPHDFFPEAADDAHAILQARRSRDLKRPQ